MTSRLDIGPVPSHPFDNSEPLQSRGSEDGERSRRGKYHNGIEEDHWALNSQALKEAEDAAIFATFEDRGPCVDMRDTRPALPFASEQ